MVSDRANEGSSVRVSCHEVDVVIGAGELCRVKRADVVNLPRLLAQVDLRRTA